MVNHGISWLLVLISTVNLMLIRHGMSSIPDDQINDDPYRTAYHFQPPQNWMNDPNGPMIYNGIYHIFYQYYPYEPIWHKGIVWGHSTSTDLINWTPQPFAFSPTEPYETNGCWSGSTTILPGNKPAILYTSGYTGNDNQNYQVQNLAFPKDLSDPYLKQWVKSPQNPIIYGTPTYKFIDPYDFRDPTTAWKLADGKWRIIIGTLQGNNGLAALFTSQDFINWTVSEHPFHSGQGTGMWECPDFFPVYVAKSIGADTSIIGKDVKHVFKEKYYPGSHKGKYLLHFKGDYITPTEIYTYSKQYNIPVKFSPTNFTPWYYQSRRGLNDVYIPDKETTVETDLELRLDYGKFYASKSFFDTKTGRRILWGWVNESSTQQDDYKKGWSGLQAIPRTIVLDESGKQLVQWPIKEVETLRGNQVELVSQVIEGGSMVEVSGITASQADVEVLFKLPELKNVEELDATWTNPQILCSRKGASIQGNVGPFGLLTLASTGLEEYTAVFFRIFKASNKYVVLMCTDLTRSSLNPTTDKLTFGTFLDVDPTTDDLSLRILIDHSILESFGGKGKSCITARVYPTLAIHNKAKLYAFNNGTDDVKITKLAAWSMNKAQLNLTTQYTSNRSEYDEL